MHFFNFTPSRCIFGKRVMQFCVISLKYLPLLRDFDHAITTKKRQSLPLLLYLCIEHLLHAAHNNDFFYSPHKHSMKRLIYIFIASLACSTMSCGGNADDAAIATDSMAQMADATTAFTADSVVHRLPTYIVPRPLRTIFTDVNDLHLAAAQAIGIEPISSLRDAYRLRVPIQRIESCNDYTLDNLSHSLPFLVPRAASLLSDIGRRFADTIRARGGHEYRIKVTSVLRTDRSVAKLRRRNLNASEVSAHSYATTFDISYSKFIALDPGFVVDQGDLKNILAEILYDEREKGRCYVKFEVKQGCFHITAR